MPAFPEAELTYEKDDWLLRFQDGEFWIQSTKEIKDEESDEDITDEEVLRLFRQDSVETRRRLGAHLI